MKVVMHFKLMPKLKGYGMLGSKVVQTLVQKALWKDTQKNLVLWAKKKFESGNSPELRDLDAIVNKDLMRLEAYYINDEVAKVQWQEIKDWFLVPMKKDQATIVKTLPRKVIDAIKDKLTNVKELTSREVLYAMAGIYVEIQLIDEQKDEVVDELNNANLLKLFVDIPDKTLED